MEKLVGQEIRCRITKLDQADEDVVVDRRGVIEEEDRATRDRRYAEVNVGDILHGTVRSLTDFGAFLDLGGMDGLLHIGEISWARVNNVADVLSVGQELDVKVVKIEPDTRRIALSLKQLLPQPWDTISDRYRSGDRVRGTVTRLTDFGAFLELEPGIEGMIHISEMSWGKKVRKPSDLLKVGDTADVVILRIDTAEKRLALGLKQALGDPWVEAAGASPPAPSSPARSPASLPSAPSSSSPKASRAWSTSARSSPTAASITPPTSSASASTSKPKSSNATSRNDSSASASRQLIPPASTTSSPSTSPATPSPAASSPSTAPRPASSSAKASSAPAPCPPPPPGATRRRTRPRPFVPHVHAQRPLEERRHPRLIHSQPARSGGQVRSFRISALEPGTAQISLQLAE